MKSIDLELARMAVSSVQSIGAFDPHPAGKSVAVGPSAWIVVVGSSE